METFLLCLFWFVLFAILPVGWIIKTFFKVSYHATVKVSDSMATWRDKWLSKIIGGVYAAMGLAALVIGTVNYFKPDPIVPRWKRGSHSKYAPTAVGWSILKVNPASRLCEVLKPEIRDFA